MRSVSGKKIYNSKAQQKAVEVNLKACAADMFLEIKHKAKEEIKNNPTKAMIRNNKLREIMKSEANAEQGILDSLAQAEKYFANEIYQHIVGGLDFSKSRYGSKFYHLNVSDEEIKKAIIECLPALNKLKLKAENGQYHRENSSHFYNEYERLFNRLIDQDIRFAYYAPEACFKRSTFQEKLDQLDDETANKITKNQEVLKQRSDLSAVFSDEEKAETKDDILKLVNEQNELEFKSKIEMIKLTEKFSKELYSFIIKDLNMQDFDETSIKYKNIEETLNYCSNALNKLNRLSNNEHLTSIAGWDQFDPHTEVFNNLIRLNIKFVFFAPKKSLNRLDIDYKRLSERERNVMLKVLIDKGLWDNDEFYENYRQLFENGHGVENGI